MNKLQLKFGDLLDRIRSTAEEARWWPVGQDLNTCPALEIRTSGEDFPGVLEFSRCDKGSDLRICVYPMSGYSSFEVGVSGPSQCMFCPFGPKTYPFFQVPELWERR